MWLWRLTLGAAIVGFALVVTTFILFLWFMVEVGFAWASAVLLVLVGWLLFSSVKNRRRNAGFDIRR